MADDGKILLNDFIDGAIVDKIKEVTSALGGLAKQVNDLKTATKQNTDATAGYTTVAKEQEAITKQIVSAEAKLKVVDTELNKELERKKQAQQAATKAVKDSVAAETSAYKRLSNEYGIALQKAKDLAAQYGVQSDKAKIAASTAKGLNDQLKAIDASMGNHQRNVGNYASALETANMSLGEMKIALRELKRMPLVGKTPEEIAAINKNMGILTDEIGDYGARLKSSGDKVSLMIEATQGFIAIAQMATGALAAFGVNTEKLEKAMVQLIGVSQALATIHQLNEKQVFKNTILTLKESFAKLKLTISTNAQAVAQARLNAVNVSAAAGLGKVAQGAAGVKAMFTSIGSMLAKVAAGFAGVAVAALAVGAALVGGVVMLGKWDAERDGTAKRERDYKKALEETATVQQKVTDNVGESVASLRIYQQIANDTSLSDEKRLDALKKITEASGDNIKVTDLDASSLRLLNDEIEKYILTITLQAEAEAYKQMAVDKYK